MSENKFDWTYFRRRIYINNTSCGELFRKWATAKGLMEWFISHAEYKDANGSIRDPEEIVKINDKYLWRFHNGYEIQGEILEVKDDSLLKFTFGEKDIDNSDQVTVTVTLNENDGNCYFDILQDNMSESNYGRVFYYISCNMGWMFHMYNLKSIIENGHDLRVKGVKRMHVDAPSGYPLEDYKWTEFIQNEYINAPIEKVFEMWVTSNNITKWFIAEADYINGSGILKDKDDLISKGDKYIWKFYQGFKIQGGILDIKENKFISFTFGKKEPGSDEDVIVEVYFMRSEDNGTKITLKQSNISDTEFGKVNYNLSCMSGWSFFLMNLRSIFESGFDLREKEEAIAAESKAYTLPR